MKTTSTIVIALLTVPLYSQLAVNPNSSGVEANATGEAATALGQSIALSDYTTAMGASLASGVAATAMGLSSVSGEYATAMGISLASANRATAMGQSTASGNRATAMGQSTASGQYALAAGLLTTASGPYSVALGRNVSTNGYEGSFFFGDNDLVIRPIGSPNQFACRFKGGYYFISGFTDPATSTGDLGVRVLANGTSWVSISDRHRKENFAQLDDVDILEKLASIPYYSWNYKGLDPAIHRHYGIMAQDFYALFGQDQFGTIGSDTLVNPIDMMGIAMSAIKGLKMQLEEEKTAAADLQKKVAEQNEMIQALKEQNETIQALRQQVDAISAALAKSTYSSSSQAGSSSGTY